MTPVKGEPLGVVCNWPPALEAALQRWGTTQAKCPCLTALDVTGKPVYTLTYGELSLRPAFPCSAAPKEQQWREHRARGFRGVAKTFLVFESVVVRAA